MKIAGHQPYFFPYIGYFMLIKHSDKFVVFDTPQFIKGGWINRNRILNHNGDPTYINVTIYKAPLRTPIKDIKIKNKELWMGRILKQLKVYEKRAPYYDEVINLFKRSLEYNTDSISQLNYHTLKETCKYLNIEYDMEVFSEMNLEIDEVSGPDEWGLNIAKAMGIKSCLNASGGMDIYDRNKYKDNGLDLKFIKPNLRPYKQGKGEFVPGLSIIDAMMFNSVEEINIMLDDYELL